MIRNNSALFQTIVLKVIPRNLLKVYRNKDEPNNNILPKYIHVKRSIQSHEGTIDN